MNTAAPRTLFDKVWDLHHILTEEGESLLYIDESLAQENTYQSFVALEKAGRAVRRLQQTFAFTDHYVPTTGRRLGLDGIAIPEIRTQFK